MNIDEKEIIVNFLTASGFLEKCKDQFHRKDTGIIFIRKYNVTKVMFQIMELGEKHHAKKLRDVLMLKDAVETCIFNPKV